MEADVSLKNAVMEILDELPQDRISAVLDFARFIKAKMESEEKIELPDLKVGSFSDLKSLIGAFDLAGDAVVDCEKYWE